MKKRDYEAFGNIVLFQLPVIPSVLQLDPSVLLSTICEFFNLIFVGDQVLNPSKRQVEL
jgi:hypothetical protein